MNSKTKFNVKDEKLVNYFSSAMINILVAEITEIGTNVLNDITLVKNLAIRRHFPHEIQYILFINIHQKYFKLTFRERGEREKH